VSRHHRSRKGRGHLKAWPKSFSRSFSPICRTLLITLAAQASATLDLSR
jgi:hypothetical protein